MKSDPRLNWHFESSSRYSGLSRCAPSSSHRLPDHLVVGRFVSSLMSSSRRLPRSSRRDQTYGHRVRLVDSWDRLITHHSSPTRRVQSSSRRTLGSSRRELIGRDWDQIVRSTWKTEELRGMLENAINKIEVISSTPSPNDNNNNNPRSTSPIPVTSRAEANWRWGDNSTLQYL